MNCLKSRITGRFPGRVGPTRSKLPKTPFHGNSSSALKNTCRKADYSAEWIIRRLPSSRRDSPQTEDPPMGRYRALLFRLIAAR
jgi:hypothetical protein